MPSQQELDYQELRNSGMLPSEARRIRLLPNWRDVPWAAEVVNQRSADWSAARRRGISREAFDKAIVNDYKEEKWLVRGLKQIQVDVHAMLRHHCDRFRQRNPDYESPWEERQRSFMRYARAVDRTIALENQG
ncbi:MAG: hypothetical protein M0R06_22980 [Sphaerochaeta sp.]|jgi:hypothetical protein|nr:hypothetical protein [Sphaerochaeta sp.]